MLGMEDGVFPHYRSLGEPKQLEEERRLAYVGITRARERLYLTHAWSRSLFGNTSWNPPSRFLAEIPSDLVRFKEADGRRTGGAGGGRSGSAWSGVSGGGGGGGVPSMKGTAKHEPVHVGPGDTVFHEKWGEGVVLSVSGSGGDVQARVAFEDAGEKQLMLAYAPLQKR
jgi:DNA helicase-2/ATP-dependent DNA helicase PcrA